MTRSLAQGRKLGFDRAGTGGDDTLRRDPQLLGTLAHTQGDQPRADQQHHCGGDER
jgi:hypothetical protein